MKSLNLDKFIYCIFLHSIFLPELIELPEALQRQSIYFRDKYHNSLYGTEFTMNFYWTCFVVQLCVSMKMLEGGLVGHI